MCATALGVQAIEHHRKRVRFFSTVELVNALEQEKAQGRAGKIAERAGGNRIGDPRLELGYLPFSASGGALLPSIFSANLRAHQRHHHHQLEQGLQRMGNSVLGVWAVSQNMVRRPRAEPLA